MARTGATRLPESVLLALTLSGGTIGAYAGMRVFHHKTAKSSFQRRFWLIVLIQALLVAAYFFWLRN